MKQSSANRGMGLETLINFANEQYRQRGTAVIHKRPTPIQVIQMRGKDIIKANFTTPSTVDFEGVYQGYSLQLEAKSTQVDTRFDLDNISDHQIEHMRACQSQEAISFLILEFANLNEIYYVPANVIIQTWDAAKIGGRKSVTYGNVVQSSTRIRDGRGIVLDYLAAIDLHIKTSV